MGYAQKEDPSYVQRLQSQFLDGGPTKQHFNAVEHARNVMEAAASLSSRVHGIVLRLMGPQNEGAEGVGERPTHGPGIFPSLHDVSDETGYAIRKANEALDRLEKELA
ncbi:hypothetical protein E5S70_17570 [Ensifer adhaerens]|uniref:hypothetical protein n=1 Tax=Ensifer canadensis TaxID=555315 RepID=UPI00148F9BF8|nr:hypothetical protein [Ensifer canadensis]NOV17863.1 hypothetical protein [Ensifer canadensis]